MGPNFSAARLVQDRHENLARAPIGACNRSAHLSAGSAGGAERLDLLRNQKLLANGLIKVAARRAGALDRDFMLIFAPAAAACLGESARARARRLVFQPAPDRAPGRRPDRSGGARLRRNYFRVLRSPARPQTTAAGVPRPVSCWLLSRSSPSLSLQSVGGAPKRARRAPTI